MVINDENCPSVKFVSESDVRRNMRELTAAYFKSALTRLGIDPVVLIALIPISYPAR